MQLTSCHRINDQGFPKSWKRWTASQSTKWRSLLSLHWAVATLPTSLGIWRIAGASVVEATTMAYCSSWLQTSERFALPSVMDLRKR